MTTTAVVTGSSSGIGRATAVALHEAGFDVVATMRDPSVGEDLPCRVERLDVTDEGSVRRLFARLGRVDVLINNAGVAGPGDCETTSVETVRAVLETNFLGVVRCSLEVVGAMRERGSGTVVNVSSLAGLVVMPTQGAYTAAKFALEGWTETLAYEVAAFGVRVALVEPGAVMTPIFEKDYPPPNPIYIAAAKRAFKVQRWGLGFNTTAQDVAHAIVAAVMSPEPRLRWRVGADAEEFYRGTKESTDEQRIALHGLEDDADFYNEFARIYGPDIRATAR